MHTFAFLTFTATVFLATFVSLASTQLQGESGPGELPEVHNSPPWLAADSDTGKMCDVDDKRPWLTIKRDTGEVCDVDYTHPWLAFCASKTSFLKRIGSKQKFAAMNLRDC